ncbi:MAG: phage tail protein [Anaerolineae bacterium]
MINAAQPLPGAADPVGSYLFEVEISGINKAVFSEVTLPALRVETEDVKEGGQNDFVHKLPIRVNAGTVVLKNGISIGDELYQWYFQVASGDFGSARKSVSIRLYRTVASQPFLTISLAQAFPIRWSGPSLRAGEAAIAIEELELAHSGITFELSS